MLRSLSIRNLAILPEVTLQFTEGLNVLTGETGAGKSILVDAISLLAGGRASSEDIRAGQTVAEVEGVVAFPEHSPAWAEFNEIGVQATGREVQIRRTISVDGRSRATIDGIPWTVTGLSRVAPYWLDISAQHGQRELFSDKFQLEILDAYCEVKSEVDEYRKCFSEAKRWRSLLEQLKKDHDEVSRQREFLDFHVRELKGLNLRIGEDEELQSRHQRSAHSAHLAENVEQVLLAIDGEEGAQDRVGKALALMRGSLKFDASLGSSASGLEVALAQLKEVSNELFHYRKGLEFEPEDLDRINERLSKLQGVNRKYGSIEKAVADLNQMVTALSNLENFEAREKEVQIQIDSAEKNLIAAAKKLTASRKKGAGPLAKEISSELKHLGMPHAEIKIVLEQPFDESQEFEVEGIPFGPNGAERAEIVFAPNVGEGFRPLSRIASGGELSRVLLAIKSVALLKDAFNGVAFLFDEVDAGIGGETAERVGIRLRVLSEGRQVLCVTHLAQIASYATTHLVVQKAVKNGRTMAQAKRLREEERVEELARMMGGIQITRKSMDLAEELLSKGKSAGSNARKAVLTLA